MFPRTIPIRYSWKMSLVLIATGALFLWAGSQPLSTFDSSRPLTPYLMKYVAPILGIFALYAWISANLLGRTYLWISETTIVYHHLFGKQEVAWRDVVEIQTFTVKRTEKVGLVVHQTVQQPGFWNSIHVGMGVRYALSFPLDQIQTISPGELLRLLRSLQRTSSGS